MARDTKHWPAWGQRLREALKLKRMTWAQAAKELDVAEISLRSWASGKRDINLKEFMGLCTTLKLDSSELLYGGQPQLSLEAREGAELIDSKPRHRAGLVRSLRVNVQLIDEESAHGADTAADTTIEHKMPVTKSLKAARENMTRAIRQPVPGHDPDATLVVKMNEPKAPTK